MKSQKALRRVFLNLRTQPGLFITWLIWGINLVGNGLVFYFLMPRSPLDIYPQYVFQSAYPSVQDLLSPGQLAWLFLVQDYLLLGAFVGLAFFLVWRKSGDILSLLISALFIAGGVQTSAVTYIESRYLGMPGFSWLDQLQNLLNVLTYYGLGIFIFIFPDGRFVPRFLGRWVGGYLLISLVGLILVSKPLGENAYGLLVVNLLILFLSGLASQVYRYHYHSTAPQRQQTKIVLLAFAVYPMFGLVFWVFLSQLVPIAYQSFYYFLVQNLGFVALVLIPLTLTTSIFRHHLWDIDVLIRRTLQYTLLTGLLALVYFSGVVLLQSTLTLLVRDLGPVVGDYYSGVGLQPNVQPSKDSMLDSVDDQPPAVTVVLSTLAVSALFNPLRRRVQDFIDQRFYRQKYDAEQALAEFAEAARSETDLEQISTHLLKTVQDTLQPDGLSLWLSSGFENWWAQR